MTEWQCGVLLAQLDRLPEQIEHKSRQAERLRAGLRAIPGLTVLARERRVTREVIYLFLFQVDEARLGVSRNRFLRALRAEGIPCGVANQPVYRSDLFPMASSPYRTACRLGGGEAAVPHECPNAERLFEQELVAIPHQLLLGSDADVDDIVAAAAKVAACAAQLSTATLKRES
jgi:dTDP-4-amino-4,6-dideoxygalactose transaminase